MKVGQLGLPVRAAKSDWLPGTTYLGFTPRDGSTNARASCQSTIQRQMADGYILEYVTEKFDEPNKGFRNDPRIIAEKAAHAEIAGRLIAIHRVRASARPLADIVGQSEFDLLQDMWADGENRVCWSVAFPIVQTFEINEKPKAKLVFGEVEYRRLFAYSSAFLRPLDDLHRSALSDLSLTERPAPNAWIAIEDEIEIACQSAIHPKTSAEIDRDLRLNAFEGLGEQREAGIRKRAVWLANRFWLGRVKAENPLCDVCGFDPAARVKDSTIPMRSIMDVHHRNPLAEGIRRTWLEDFSLLCPNCHRLEHAMLRRGQSLLNVEGPPCPS